MGNWSYNPGVIPFITDRGPPRKAQNKPGFHTLEVVDVATIFWNSAFLLDDDKAPTWNHAELLNHKKWSRWTSGMSKD